MTAAFRCRVAVEAPQHTGLTGPLDYLSERPLSPGALVRVPLGRRTVAGIVWPGTPAEVDPGLLRPVAEVLGSLPPFEPRWCELVEFASAYYQRSIGEEKPSGVPLE